MHKDYIDRYIHFHTVESVIERGEKLYKEEAIQLNSIDYNADLAEFSIQGTSLYEVRVQGFMTKSIQTSCSCPYHWNALCKHSVAALLHISHIDESIQESKLTKELFHRENGLIPMAVPQYLRLNKTLIQRYIDRDKQNYYVNRGKITHVKDIEENSVTIGFRSDYYYETEEVFFKLIDEQLFLSSSFKMAINGYNAYETGVLNELIRIGHATFFKYIFGDSFAKRVSELKKNYHLPDNYNFNDFFKLKFNHYNEIELHLHKEGLGLLSPSSQDQNIFHLSNIVNTTEQIQNQKKKDVREIGFVIFPKSDYDHVLRIQIIKGKSNKSGTELSSYIEEHYQMADNEITYPTEQQQKIINLIREYDDNLDKDDFGRNKAITEEQNIQLRDTLSIIQNIFSLLNKERFVYYSSNMAYYLKIKKKNLVRTSILNEFVKLKLKVSLKDSFYALYSQLQINDKTIQIDDKIIESADPFAFFHDNKIYTYENLSTSLYIQNYKYSLRIHKEHKDYFIREYIIPLSRQFSIEFEKNIGIKEEHYPNPEFRQIYISEEDELLKFSPVMSYSNGLSFSLSNYGNKLEINNEQITEYKRDTEYEKEFLHFISGLHPHFEQQKYNRFFYLSFDELMHNMWFYKFYEQLQKEGIDVFGINELKHFKYSPHQAKVATTLKSGQDWFELDIQIRFGNYQIKIADLKKAIINKQQYIQLKNGTVGILPEEWLDKFQKYFRHGQVDDNKLLISKLRFSIIDELYEGIDNEQILKEITEKKILLEKVNEIERIKIPRGIKTKLRDYQKEGLQWLHFLNTLKWGGILADDMGLGKTLQMLTFFKSNLKKNDPPVLIIVPTTLLFNWENEIAKFTPSLKAHYYYGITREKSTEKFSEYDLIFTSYGVLVRDIELLKEYQFKYIVLDESQAIKNPMSQRYKAANLLKAKNKFALTGTPIENSTFDLYAQMNFVNPGFFGDIKSFKENYSNKIDKEADIERSIELQKLSHPFILRRTKEQVATELPPKTENVLYCEMESEQRKIYEAYRNEYRDKILKKIEEEGMGKSKMYILEGLLRLRQICDSPSLIKKENIDSKQSIKIQELLRFISEKTANHKILVFSQFVGMLHLIRKELDKHQIDYEYLDGQSTKNQRKESVEFFQSNESIRVFLVSLKAGGTGLNLTAADYVFIVDPWWNPAVEEQAIDRCYRIGQDKKVFAYRMICKNTVEEKILNLQSKKKKIAKDIIQTDENIMKTIQPADIRDLFS